MTYISVMHFFVYDYLLADNFEVKSRKELKDGNYAKFRRESSELH